MTWDVANKTRGLAGGSGPPGASATIAVGSVSTGAPGSSVSVTNVGTASAATFNFVIPRGDTGLNGSNGTNGTNGTAATVAVGSVTTGAPGSSAAVVNSGTSGAAVLDFTIPRGNAGATGPTATPGTPNTRSIAFGTAYQATDPTKSAFISAMIDAAYTVTVAGTVADTVELRIGPNSTTVANGTGGTAIATFRASLTGIVLAIGMGMGQRNQLSALVPPSWYFALRRVSGTTATINAAYDQSLG